MNHPIHRITRPMLLSEACALIGNAEVEVEVARWIKVNCEKPVASFFARATAPEGRRMGHADAIVGGAEDIAAVKIAVFKKYGIEVATAPIDMADLSSAPRRRMA